jgi:pyruvate dehydrogenase E1 component alpha subunit
MSVTQKAHPARTEEIPEAMRLRLFQLLVEIRHTEKRAYDLFLQNLVKGTSHLALGQEAVAAGFAAAMNKDDYTFCTYRGHHHTLARGASMKAVLGELMGRQCGLMKGKGGSMHLTSVEHGVMGRTPMRRVPAHRRGRARSAQYRGTAGGSRFLRRRRDQHRRFPRGAESRRGVEALKNFCCENNMYME